jgi:hypothetical protein
MFTLTIHHLIDSNFSALENGTLQAQSPHQYDDNEENLLGYYVTPDGKYNCCTGCVLPERVRLPLKGLVFDMRDILNVLFRTDVDYFVLWQLHELHDFWLNGRCVGDTPSKVRDVLTGTLGFSDTAEIDEQIYREFLTHLRATSPRPSFWRRWATSFQNFVASTAIVS